jgi:hypothetical protein
MRTFTSRIFTHGILWSVSVGIVAAADGNNVTQVDWETRTASCPAKVTQSTSATIRVSKVNDLLIDFKTGETAEYQLRAKGTPVSVVPSENPFLPQVAVTGVCDPVQLAAHLNAVRQINNPSITPPADGRYVPLSETIAAAHNQAAVTQVEVDKAIADQACRDFFSQHANDSVVQWINRLDAQPGNTSSGAPPHSVDFNVNLEPNQNYEYTIRASWKGRNFRDGTLRWNCGESDILSLSVGPLITTLPYRTYSQQQVPVSGGGTQNELVVSGNTNVNVLGAALLNYHLPPIRGVPQWTGLALSVGPVYTLGDAPRVSKLGLFVGASMHLYRSLFLTPGIHIGQFADFPAGFHPGDVIPPNFGSLTPVTRNTAHFAVGITFKTTSFKKSSQNNGVASNAGSGSPSKTGTQPVSGSHGAQGQASQGSRGSQGQSSQGNQDQGNQGGPPAPTPPQPSELNRNRTYPKALRMQR